MGMEGNWCFKFVIIVFLGIIHSSRWFLYTSLANERRTFESAQWTRRLPYCCLCWSREFMGLCYPNTSHYSSSRPWGMKWCDRLCEEFFSTCVVFLSIIYSQLQTCFFWAEKHMARWWRVYLPRHGLWLNNETTDDMTQRIPVTRPNTIATSHRDWVKKKKA